jgi:CRISPR/Cas system-associated exonuclease Cas4 (RecB family)
MLKELIDKFYLENQRNKEQTRFYITDAGKCPRAVFFKFKNAPKEPTNPRIMRIFEHGENIHRSIFNVLYRLKIGVTTEIPIPPQEIVSGRADAILCMDNENYVLDIKSINSMIFRNLGSPKEENIYQIQLYMHFFGIKKGILLYVDKDQQELKEFFIDYDEKLCSGLMDKFYALKGQIESDVLPERLNDYPKNWQCNYCVFREICKTASKEDFKTENKMQSA